MQKKRKNNAIVLPFALFCALFFFGVADGSQKIGEKAAEKAEIQAPSETERPPDLSKVSENPSSSDYLYDPTGKLDPFRSFIAEQETMQGDKEKPKTYLETLDLAQLELIAIIINSKDSYAMVQDAKGLGHVIRNGTPIGTNGGVVKRINEAEVIVSEEFLDFRGQLITKEVQKRLPSHE
jgi:type IV pilus assembly protein PilP